MLNITTLAVLLVIFGAYTHALSIRNVSEKTVNKRDAGEFYPDWVPFKNKKGDGLGEFVQVKKKKPAKRLAPPVNFVLKAVAEPEGDDYYEKGQGESDSEDYIEKKEWSDQNRLAKPVKSIKPAQNSTEISDIEGIVNFIITDKRPDDIEPSAKTEVDGSVMLAEENKPAKETLEEVLVNADKEDVEAKTESNESEVKDKDERQENAKHESDVGLLLPIEYQTDKKDTSVEDTRAVKKPKEYSDYEEENTEKAKPEPTEEEKKEAEDKKQRILGLVDDLKRRHEKEQREISERAKEDEIIKEERERDMSRGRVILHSSEADEAYDKYNNKNDNKERLKSYYNDYDETNDNGINDKYKIHPPTKKPTTVPSTIAPVTVPRTTRKRTRTPKSKRPKTTPNKHEESGKLSVFKNPKLYMMYDDSISHEASSITSSTETTHISPRKTPRRRPTTRRTSTTPYTTPALLTSNESSESVRISLVPDNNEVKDGEPTLFFPQKKKNKRRRKNKPRIFNPEPDSFVAESVNGFAAGITSPDVNVTGFSAPDSTLETKVGLTSSEASMTSPSASGTSEVGIDSTGTGDALTSAAASAVTDAVASATGHTKSEPKHENYHKEKGKCCFIFR